jgi:ATP-binding cassette subfamily C protein CydD
VLQAYALSQTISRVFLDRQTLADVRVLLVALLGLAIARAVLLWGGEVAANHVAGQIKTELRARLFAHLLALGPAYTRDEQSGELVNTMVEGIEALDAYFSQYLPQLALSALVPISILVFVFPLDALSGVVLLGTAPLIPFFMVLIGKLAAMQSRRQWTALSHMSAHFLDVLQGLTTLKLFGRSRDQTQIIARISNRFRKTTMSVLSIAFLSALVLEMLATISTAIVAVEIGLRLLYARLTFAEAFFVLILAPEFYLPLRMLGTRFHAGVSGVTAAERIFEILETPLKDASSSAPPSGQAREGEKVPSISLQVSSLDSLERGLTGGAGIRFEDVHYAYDSRDRPALNGVSFGIMPGRKIALVGPSGAGKSTVAQLLLRFLDPTAGRIVVGDMPLSDLPAAAWRAQVAWVPQLPYLFHASVVENIRLARPDALPDEVMQAAQQAHTDEFIRALPDGYDTLIGERGARLSSGQAQRIALARAFLKNAPLLILDEATSNLDPETEAHLQDAIYTLMRIVLC